MTKYGNLKIAYHGKQRLVRYKLNSTYEQILERIIHLFHIAHNRKSSLYFTNMSGKVLSKRQLNNYLSLFPNPRTTFHLRYKNKVNSKRSEKLATKATQNKGTSATTKNKTQKRPRDHDHDDNDYDPSYPTTPVFRMNCFIGVYPTKCSPPPAKRVRFSEHLNSTRIIPARSQLDAKKGVLFRRIPSFYDSHAEIVKRSQKETSRLASIISQTVSESTGALAFSESPTTQFALCSPLHRTKSFINTYPATQSLISSFYQKKARRMLSFGNALKFGE